MRPGTDFVAGVARPLSAIERMVEVFDRASTMNFILVARVRGELSRSALERALRKLERRHPLLRASIARAPGPPRFVPGAGAPIPLRVVEAPEHACGSYAADSLEHRHWPDAGPRAELTWLRHQGACSSLLFCFHHLISDGASAVIAMRDLLEFASRPELDVNGIPSPGQEAFYPAGCASFANHLRLLALIGRSLLSPKPDRLRPPGPVPIEQRKVRLSSLEFAASESAALAAQARADGATVHGALCAGLALAIAQTRGGATRQQISHPLDLRRYLRELCPERPAIGEAVGYYASLLQTEHRLTPDSDLGALARAISAQVRRRKRAREPLLMRLASPHALRLDRALSAARFREFSERTIFHATFTLTNLGALEPRGARAEVGPLCVEQLRFAAAGSVGSALTVAAASFRGALSLQLVTVEPLISAELAGQLGERARALLRAYASRR